MTLIANCIRSALYAALGFVLVALVAYPLYVGYVYLDVYGSDANTAGYIDLMKNILIDFSTML